MDLFLEFIKLMALVIPDHQAESRWPKERCHSFFVVQAPGLYLNTEVLVKELQLPFFKDCM